MASTTNPTATPATSSLKTQYFTSSFDWLLLCGIVSLTPLLYFHSLNLWARPHFQFFPLAWAAFVYLVFTRSVPETTHGPRRWWCGVTIASLSVLTTATAVVVFSPWLAHVSLILICLAWMLLRLNRTPWHLPLAWVSLLIITLPMPLNLDTRMVQTLQSWSTASASGLLDFSSVPHLASGNVLEIRTGKLFVDEACSGVDSLYSLAALALLLAIWNRKSFLLGLLVFASVPFWAWLGNVIRIYVIAFMLDRYAIDWSHGWQHTLLGLSVFAFSFWNLLLTQRALEIAFAPFPIRTVTSGPVHSLYNRLVSWPGTDPAQSSRKSSRRSELPPIEVAATEEAPQIHSRNKLGYSFSAVFLVLGLLSALPILGIGPWTQAAAPIHEVPVSAVEAKFSADLLPAQLAGAKQVGFDTSHRERSSFFGEHSATWQYHDGQHNLLISLDFPFSGFHGLEECYVLSGGELMSPITRLEPAIDGWVMYEGRFAQDLESSYLVYTEFDQAGQPVVAQGTFERGALALSQPPATFQVQLYVQDAGDVSDAERERYRAILAEVATTLLPTIQTLELR